MNAPANETWLMQTADAPIRYQLRHDAADAEALCRNSEAAAWLSRLAQWSDAGEIGKIHGSHDYRMENILGKCWSIGLSAHIPLFDEKLQFILRHLRAHIQIKPPDELSFGKLYHYRDDEKVLACFLPLLGYHDDLAVLHIVRKRIDLLYDFTKQGSYDIYVDGSKFCGVKKAWQPYLINPDLYADGHIALPDMHDFLLFAGMYPYLNAEDRRKVETAVGWLFGDGYGDIIGRYGYFYAPDGSYSTKAIIFKLQLLDFRDMVFDQGDLVPLLFTVFVLSHFQTARESLWFSLALAYLNQYKNEQGRYIFPAYMITEKPDCYVIFGGHMNAGENKKAKLFREIISTYWMERIHKNVVKDLQ
ncbi:MAG: hypothetical protein QM689_07440 [Oscillospiraceae bacterium]